MTHYWIQIIIRTTTTTASASTILTTKRKEKHSGNWYQQKKQDIHVASGEAIIGPEGAVPPSTLLKLQVNLYL